MNTFISHHSDNLPGEQNGDHQHLHPAAYDIRHHINQGAQSNHHHPHLAHDIHDHIDPGAQSDGLQGLQSIRLQVRGRNRIMINH